MNKPIEKYSEEELLEIIRRAENTNIPGSTYQNAINEFHIREQRKLLDEQRYSNKNLIRANWLVAIATILSVISATSFSYLQNRQAAKQESASLMFQISENLRSEKNSALVYAIAIHQQPLLQHNGGKFSDENLDDYLVKYELLYSAYQADLISLDMIDTAFGYDLKEGYKNPEIKKFISDAQKEENDNTLYKGFISLAELQ